ncbi:MAG: pentapeptide repeat-containing protein, partial [Planctomyces sp.]
MEIDSDIRTSNFLTRDEDGNYGFGHKSYREFFYARAVRTGLLQCSFDLIAKQRLSPEEVGFTVDLLNMAPDSLLGVISTLEGILTKEYRRFVSENALLILIAIRRGPIWERSERVASVKLPDCMQLQGAILNQVDLRGVTAVAADLSGADLSESVLSQCVLANAKAVNTRFVSSVLSYSHWSNGDFHNANFTSANLNKASFVFASLRGCLFHNTAVVDVNVAGANLSNINYDGVLLGDGVVAKGAGYLPLLEFLSVREEMQWNLNDLLSDPVFLREVQSVVSRVTGERRDCDGSEDVVQSILLEVLMGREKLRFLNRRKLLDYIKWSASRFAGSRMFWSSRLDGDANAVLHAPEPFVRPSGLDGEAVSFEARALRKGLGLMGSMERQIVERKLEGRSNIEIASELRCSVHSVHRRWSMI